MKWHSIFYTLGYLTKSSLADVPTNCMVTDFWGDWTFNLGLQGTKEAVTNGTAYVNLGPISGTHSYTFAPDNLAINNDSGSQGTVTFIYNQGFEFIIDNKMWFVNFYFDKSGYSCEKTSVGFVHDTQGRSWARIQGVKNSVSTPKMLPFEDNNMRLSKKFKESPRSLLPSRLRLFQENPSFTKKVNENAQGFWTAKHDKNNEKYTVHEMNLRFGHSLSSEDTQSKIPESNRNFQDLAEKAAAKHRQIIKATGMPENLDWRNKDGENYVSPVDDQGGCGSCYSFASNGLLESRIRIQTNNQQQPIFSEQEVITCGKDKTYNQGCIGGFAYETAGKYAYDFGVVEESCVPYNPSDRVCADTSKCTRWYSSDYGYIGGYYGAAMGDGGQQMMEDMQNGPLAVGFMVLDDFRDYSNGVYISTMSKNTDILKDDFNPFVAVNHAVLAVGYGVCDGVDPTCGSTPAGTPYWIVKNSWGTSFGMDGYFYILRGVDEVGIESIVVKASVVPQL